MLTIFYCKLHLQGRAMVPNHLPTNPPHLPTHLHVPVQGQRQTSRDRSRRKVEHVLGKPCASYHMRGTQAKRQWGGGWGVGCERA